MEITDELISILNQFKFVGKITDTSNHAKLFDYKLQLLKLKDEDYKELGNAVGNIYRIISINKE